MNPGLVFSWLPVVGIVVGLMRARFPKLPWIAAALVVAAFAVYMTMFGVYAARCWNCSGDVTSTRGDSFLVAGIFFGLMLIVTLAGIAVGARLTVVLGRLRDAARDVRDGFRRDGEQPHPPAA